MVDKQRWRYGDTNPVVAAVDAETVIEIGDLLWQHIDSAGHGNVRPASMVVLKSHPELTSREHELLRQERFTNNFLGVAMQRSRGPVNRGVGAGQELSRVGETVPIHLATTGVFEFDCPSGTFELGDLIGVNCVDGVGQMVQPRNQQVAMVTDSKLAIGRVDKREPTPAGSVLVRIQSRVMTGGVAGSSR